MSHLFYGWVIVAAACMITFLGFGSAYTFCSFIGPIQHEFVASRGSVSIIFSLASFLTFGAGLFTGPLADRWGSRYMAMSGMILLGVGLILAGLAHSMVQIYIGYGLGVGIGVGCAYVPSLGTVQRWFVKHRGLASGFAVSGIGLGTLIMPPLASKLIETWGWREAYLILGLFAVVVGGSTALLLINNPEDLGLTSDGAPSNNNIPINPHDGSSVAAAVKTTQFAALYAASLLGSFAVFVPFVHLVPYALDHHVKQALAVMLLSIIGLGSTIGRFFLGGLADRVGREAFLVAMFAGIGASLVIWAIAMNFEVLALFAFLFGVFYGGWIAIIPTVVMDYFGGKNISSIIGILYTSIAVGALGGPTAAGFIFDICHSYVIPILVGAGISIVAACILALGIGKKRSPLF